MLDSGMFIKDKHFGRSSRFASGSETIEFSINHLFLPCFYLFVEFIHPGGGGGGAFGQNIYPWCTYVHIWNIISALMNKRTIKDTQKENQLRHYCTCAVVWQKRLLVLFHFKWRMIVVSTLDRWLSCSIMFSQCNFSL